MKSNILIDQLNLTGDLKKVIKQRLKEIDKCLAVDAPLAAIFLCGSVLEGILYGVAKNNAALFSETKQSLQDGDKDQRKNFREWELNDLINTAARTGFLNENTKSASILLGNFRNHIHPRQQIDNGIYPTRGAAKVFSKILGEVIRQIANKLSTEPKTIFDIVHPLKNPSLHGEARFDYSNHNGQYCIGKGKLKFTTEWTKASDKSIHCYNDPDDIRSIALIPKDEVLSLVSSVTFTSCVRTPTIGQFVILQNANGMYALLRILGIKDTTRGASADELHFKYWINKSGSDDFSYVEDDS